MGGYKTHFLNCAPYRWSGDKLAKFYITTPIYYTNAVPHIGHAYTTVIADIIARWRRLKGDDVFFLTGLDENSSKTVEAAKTQGFSDIQEYTDSIAEKWLNVWGVLNISNDDFIRTTQARHKINVQKIFNELKERGDIYKGTYEGLYCDGCEAYYAEDELVDGKCPLHLVPPNHVKEENYFFRLSKYRDQILEHIELNPDFIQPDGRRNEVVSFLKGGLKDVSVSRPGIEWGIEIPGDPSQKAWVWFDALINYLVVPEHWPADLQLIAKDILRFHCVIWPGILLSTGYELPKRIFSHGFLTVGGQKISKSLGNVVDPIYLTGKYSADAVRYFIARLSLAQDGDFSETLLCTRLNDELADVFGNFIHRTLTFTQTNYGGKIPNGRLDQKLQRETRESVLKIERFLEEMKVSQALEEIMAIAKRGNEYFQSRKPWVAIKSDPDDAADCILNCVNIVKALNLLISPFLPKTSEKLAEQLGIKIGAWENAKDFYISAGHAIGKPSPLFQKLELPEKNSSRIPFSDFEKLDLRVGKVTSAEPLSGTKKLLKLEVDIGEEKRTLVAGIADQYSPEEILGKTIVVVTNLEPAKIKGVLSDGMLLAAEDNGEISILTLDRPSKPGSKIS